MISLPSRFSPVAPSATGVEVLGECAGQGPVKVEALLPRSHWLMMDFIIMDATILDADIPRRLENPSRLNTSGRPIMANENNENNEKSHAGSAGGTGGAASHPAPNRGAPGGPQERTPAPGEGDV